MTLYVRYRLIFKTYDMSDYRVTIKYHTQRGNFIKKYKASGNGEEVAKRLCLGTLLLEETRYIKLDSVEVEDLNKDLLDEWMEEE